MESHYEINVSLNGQHFFATAPRSCTSERDARKVATAIRERFLEQAGFKVDVTYWSCGGKTCKF